MASYFATNYRIGDGVTTVWNVSFAGARPDQGDGTEAYLDPDSVEAVAVTVNEDGTETTSPLTGELIGPTQYKIDPAVAVGQTIKIYRITERGYPLVDFTDFAAITENDLDVQARQTLYVVQELSDVVQDSNTRSGVARVASATALKNSEESLAVAQSAATDSTTALAQASTAVQTSQSASSIAAEAASVAEDIINFQDQLNVLADRVQRLTGVDVSSLMVASNNLSEVVPAIARAHLRVKSAQESDQAYFPRSGSLSDLPAGNAEAVRSSLGLGALARLSKLDQAEVGDASTFRQRAGITDALTSALNTLGDLSTLDTLDQAEVGNAGTVRGKLGLGVAATGNANEVLAALGLDGDLSGLTLGSNANGNYIRAENGFQICWNVVNTWARTTVTWGAGLYLSHNGSGYTATFPAEFISSPAVTPSVGLQSGVDSTGKTFAEASINTAAWGIADAAEPTGCRVLLVGVSDRAGGKVGYIATGRWK